MIEIRMENWRLTPELSLMLDIVLRKNLQIPEDLDWDRFESALQQHRVQPLLIRGLKGMGADTLEGYPVLKNTAPSRTSMPWRASVDSRPWHR